MNKENRGISTPQPSDEPLLLQMAEILYAAFQQDWPHAWSTLDEALAEVRECVAPERICRVAMTEDGVVLGWIGGLELYDGNVFELHPLAVRPDYQGRGIGRALVEDLECQVAARGAVTLWLGTDDEAGMTSLAGRDLYPNVLEHLTQIQNRRRHPYEFYQKLGFVIAGVLPDANGPGKPDIYMAKRVKGTAA
jgi:aminoglycoside 6'-N-acetyltransferase I